MPQLAKFVRRARAESRKGAEQGEQLLAARLAGEVRSGGPRLLVSTETSPVGHLGFGIGLRTPRRLHPDGHVEAQEIGVMEPFLQSLLVSALLLLAELAIKELIRRLRPTAVPAV